MSRWSRRSQNEKQVIIQKLDSQQKEVQNKVERMNYLSTDWRMKALKEGEIPLYCNKHGWTHSKRYTLVSRNDMFGNSKYIIGNCLECNARIETLVPMNSVRTILFSLVMAQLATANRLEDKR